MRTKSEKAKRQQWEALVEVIALIDAPALTVMPNHCWYQGPAAGPELEEFSMWQLCAAVVQRMILWRAAGLPVDTAQKKLLRWARRAERKAYARLRARQGQIVEDWNAGRIAQRPPWWSH